MRLKSIVKPALVVFLGLVLYLIASNVGAGWLYVIVAALAGIVLISIPLPWLGVRHVGITRRAPVVATAGEPFECSLEIENWGPPPQVHARSQRPLPRRHRKGRCGAGPPWRDRDRRVHGREPAQGHLRWRRRRRVEGTFRALLRTPQDASRH